MTSVFISHSTRDRQFVENEVLPALRRRGVLPWYSPNDIRTSDEWERKIVAGLRESQWFLVVLSPNAVDSKWVKAEVHWAMENRDGKVIPLLLKDCNVDDIHLRLRILQYVDCRKGLPSDSVIDVLGSMSDEGHVQSESPGVDMTFGVFKQLGRDFDGITFHHLFERPHPDHTPQQDKADLWSFAAAHAAEFGFNYEFFVELVNRRISGGFHPISPPTPFEFLEILEFRLCEQERVLKGDDPYWQWPSTWPAKPSWNSFVLENPAGSAEPLKREVDATRKAIHIQKIALGHGRELPLDHWALDLISGVQRRLLQLPEFCVGYRPMVPVVISSLDLPESAKIVPTRDNCQTWDIDGTLGQYNGGDAITIFVRAIERCANALQLPHRDVFLIVLIHETAHFIVHSLPDAQSESKREPWPREAYDKTTSQVHEGLAQLLTHLTVGRFNDHHSRTFESLVDNQSADYRVFRELLAATDDEERLLRSIIPLRLRSEGAALNDWLEILRQ